LQYHFIPQELMLTNRPRLEQDFSGIKKESDERTNKHKHFF